MKGKYFGVLGKGGGDLRYYCLASSHSPDGSMRHIFGVSLAAWSERVLYIFWRCTQWDISSHASLSTGVLQNTTDPKDEPEHLKMEMEMRVGTRSDREFWEEAHSQGRICQKKLFQHRADLAKDLAFCFIGVVDEPTSCGLAG